MIKDRNHFPEFLIEHGLVSIGVEVGVDRARYSERLLEAWPGRLMGVDSYPDGTQRHAEAVSRMRPFILNGRFDLYHRTSLSAARLFTDKFYDFVYLDADHSYEAVVQDIRAWYPKIKSGGYLCGHDFHYGENCGVIKAVVDEVIDKLKLPVWVTPCTSWWVRVP